MDWNKSILDENYRNYIFLLEKKKRLSIEAELDWPMSVTLPRVKPFLKGRGENG